MAKKYTVEYFHQEESGRIVPNSIHTGRTNLEPEEYLRKRMRNGKSAKCTGTICTIPSDTIEGAKWYYFFTENY